MDHRYDERIWNRLTLLGPSCLPTLRIVKFAIPTKISKDVDAANVFLIVVPSTNVNTGDFTKLFVTLLLNKMLPKGTSQAKFLVNSLFSKRKMTKKQTRFVEKSLPELLIAADLGDAQCQYSLGLTFSEGIAVPKDEKLAFQYLKSAGTDFSPPHRISCPNQFVLADQGHRDAQYDLHFEYYGTGGVPKNDKLALKYLTLSSDQGHPSAQYLLALYYLRGGLGITENPQLGLKYLRLSADAGNAKAQSELGDMYYHGLHGLKMDTKMEFKWFKAAADQGHPKAQARLAAMYREGDPIPRDEKLCFRLNLLAAHQGEPLGFTGLGTAYRDGSGVEKDLKLAVKYYQTAVDLGCKTAQYNLGCLYYEGIGVKQDYKKAIELWQTAADQGLVQGLVGIGGCYFNGYGVEKDGKKAFQIFSEAAETGCANAIYHVALCYDQGIGVKKDKPTAVQYFRKVPSPSSNLVFFFQGACIPPASVHHHSSPRNFQILFERSSFSGLLHPPSFQQSQTHALMCQSLDPWLTE